LPDGNLASDRKVFHPMKPFVYYLERNTFQTHTVMGGLAFNRKDERRIPMFLLNNILGGPALNSRLNMSVRERHGYTYHIESVYQPYTDTGVFSIYMGTDNGNLKKALALVERELEKTRKVPLGSLQLQQAKKQLIGQISIANDSNLNRMFSLGKTFLHDDKVDSIKGVREKIEAVTHQQVLEVANEVLSRDKLSLLVFQNRVSNPGVGNPPLSQP